jgi:hypothetical protein
MCKVTLATGSIVGYAYADGVVHRLVQRQPVRAVCVHQPRARSVLVGLLDHDDGLQRGVPQLFWFKRFVRNNLVVVFIISILVNIGMWFERFVIIVISLHRDFLPSNWGYYSPPGWTSAPTSARSDCSSPCSCCSCGSCR